MLPLKLINTKYNSTYKHQLPSLLQTEQKNDSPQYIVHTHVYPPPCRSLPNTNPRLTLSPRRESFPYVLHYESLWHLSSSSRCSLPLVYPWYAHFFHGLSSNLNFRSRRHFSYSVLPSFLAINQNSIYSLTIDSRSRPPFARISDISFHIWSTSRNVQM